MRFLLFVFIYFGCGRALYASTCTFIEPIICKNPSLELDKHTFEQLKKRVKNYRTVWEDNSNFKKKSKQFRCSKAKEIDYQLYFIEKFAKKNQNLFCEEHFKILILQTETLIDSQTAENQSIKGKKAKLQLLDSAMDVSEALVNYKRQHPLSSNY
ncbi:MAG: hypothetical protein H6623_09515 [Bdellovibrionaceae bacterium]|nr:hypothetical protein [Pseudobdellovibrionaceae bacterium]